MRKLLVAVVTVFLPFALSAQGGNVGFGGDDKDYKSLSDRLLNLENKTENFNLFLNYAASYQLSDESNEWESAFKAKQFRLEIKGQFGEHLTYRFRHRLNKSNAAMGGDNFAKATDIMLIGWKFNDKVSIMGGKSPQFWGGYEYDENPMTIYQYSDILDNVGIFLTGVALSVKPVPEHEFVFNITDSYNGSFAEEYGANVLTSKGALVQAAKHPLTYILNWNGSFFGGKLTNRWGIGSYTQAKHYHDNMVILGQQLNLPKLQWYIDYMGSFEGLDRLCIATRELSHDGSYLTHVRYNSFVSKMNWQFAPRFNLMLQGMYETAAVKGLGKYRTSMGYFSSLEYYPMEGQDFRIFIAYLGRNYRYGSNVDLGNYSTNRIEVGLMFRIKAY